jgi:tetratricopeptide (TPR) repeat protein
MLEKLIVDYVNDPENPDKNYLLGLEYEKLGQTAAAISYLLRAAERTKDQLIEYECLLRIGNCFDRQKNRVYTVKSMYNAAITLMPDRPEAYYLLSRILENEKLYFESYTMTEIALKHVDSVPVVDMDVGYQGKWCLLFQKAVAAWWRGRGMEARKIFQTLLDDWWNEIDDQHKKSIESNIVSLGSGPESYAFRMYDRSMYDKLRFKFPGADRIERNFAQVYQDLFILSVLNGKRNGTFFEIGGADPWKGNNTALLEKEFEWTGISVEYDKKFVDEYTAARPNTMVLHHDALTLN